jgi:hypothetical protein
MAQGSLAEGTNKMTYTIKLRHSDGSHSLIEQCKTLEIAYAIIGEHVVKGWTFISLEVR